MKNIIIIIFSSFILLSCSDKEVQINSLVERNGLVYEVNQNNPYSGKVFEKYNTDQYKISGYYDKGLKTGTWEYFKDNGQITEKSNFSNGKLDGKFEKFNDKNVLIEIKNYKQGKLDGLSEFFSKENFKIRSEEYKNGKLNGNYKNYNKEGKVTFEGNYIDDKKNGLWSSNHSDNSGVDENYKNGDLDGEYKEYNAKREIINQGFYKNGKKTGKWVERYEKDRVKSEMVFSDNGKMKSHKEWDKNKQISRESVYPGMSKWYKNGKKIAEGHFRNRDNLKESSLKIWQNNNLLTIATLTKYNWQGKYIKTNRGLGYFYHHFNYNDGKPDYWKQSLSGGRWSSTHNRGPFKVDPYALPDFNIKVTPNKRNFQYVSLRIKNWNGTTLNVNGQTWTKVDKDEY